MADSDEPDWGEAKDVVQALVKRESATAAGALLGLAEPVGFIGGALFFVPCD